MDIQSLDKWDAYTDAKEAMFHYTDSEHTRGEPDDNLIGPPSVLSEHNPGLAFPDL